MPIYEYCCAKCNHKFELLRSFDRAKEDASCPRCRQPAKKILSRFASFSKGDNGESVPIAGTSSSCGSCSATSCSSCH